MTMEPLPFDMNHTVGMPTKVAGALCRLATTSIPKDVRDAHMRYPYDVLSQHVRLQVRCGLASLMHTNALWAVEAVWTLEKGRENQGEPYSCLLDARLLAARLTKEKVCDVCAEGLQATRINPDYLKSFSLDDFVNGSREGHGSSSVDARLLKIVSGTVAAAGCARPIMATNGNAPITMAGHTDLGSVADVEIRVLLMPIRS